MDIVARSRSRGRRRSRSGVAAITVALRGSGFHRRRGREQRAMDLMSEVVVSAEQIGEREEQQGLLVALYYRLLTMTAAAWHKQWTMAVSLLGASFLSFKDNVRLNRPFSASPNRKTSLTLASSSLD
ncbi:hypothetical protein AAC387_Pa02g4613 [Persea americana]